MLLSSPLFTLLLVAAAWVTSSGPAAALAPGDIVVGGTGELLRVDPVTGDRSVLSGPGVGTGPAVDVPLQIAFDHDGYLIVTDNGVPGTGLHALMRVDPVSGDRTEVASQTIGTGLPFHPCGVDRPVLDSYLVSLPQNFSIVFVDPVTGDRTEASSGTVGGGPAFKQHCALRVRGPGTKVFTNDWSAEAVMEVDWSTGLRTILSGPGVGAGPGLQESRGLALAVGGDFFVADSGLDAIVRIDGSTGDRSIVSDAVTGSGPAFDVPYDLRSEANGSLVVLDFGLSAVIRVDPSTGDRTIVSDSVTGSGPGLGVVNSIAVTPTPRAINGFESDVPGLPPSGVPTAGNVFVEPVIDAPEGAQVLTLSTGPGANGLGPQGQDITGDGNVESDRAQVFFSFERQPTDPPYIMLEVAVLTDESSAPGVGRADPVTIGLDDVQPPYLLAQSVHFDNGSHTALSGFTGGSRSGLDGSIFDEGQVGYETLQIPVNPGPHFFFFDVADEQDDVGDTAWRIDDLRFVPEPATPMLLAPGIAVLFGLAVRRSRRESSR
jgi:hypothetical protein